MATTRIMSLHTGKGQTVETAISNIIGYVQNSAKTDNGRLITSYQCGSQITDAEFLFSSGSIGLRPDEGVAWTM